MKFEAVLPIDADGEYTFTADERRRLDALR